MPRRNITKYQLEYRYGTTTQTVDVEPAYISVGSETVVRYLLDTYYPDKDYYFKARAYSDEYGDWSEEVSRLHGAKTPPPGPENLRVTGETVSSIEVQWRMPSAANVTGWRFELSYTRCTGALLEDCTDVAGERYTKMCDPSPCNDDCDQSPCTATIGAPDHVVYANITYTIELYALNFSMRVIEYLVRSKVEFLSINYGSFLWQQVKKR